MLTRLLASALFAGLAAGLIATALQFAFVQPVLLEAEKYESGELTHFAAKAGVAGEAEHDHDSHDHSAAFTGDGIDFRRDGQTTLFNIFVYAGYGLLLAAAFGFAETRGITITARTGILWGLAGFIAVQFAPAIGLAPELPGSAAADVDLRQYWWAGTVIATSFGLWLLAFGKGWAYWAAAIVLFTLPHVIGAPGPAEFAGPTPPELAAEFATRALGVGMIAWVVLGLSAAHFWAKDAEVT
ncbi:MAG: cobalt transporter subunit CbtA [Paracoccaceae bacterium]|jgi:cobalt transporter subunit CbtA